jgi:transcriptional regulator GlxA family with amidase domain
MNTAASSLQVAILAFDDVEALDFAGPFEVFTTASRVLARTQPTTAPLFSVHCVARQRAPVRARAGLQILPDQDFASSTATDVLIVPGGVVDAALACPDTLAWIRQVSATAQITASVCTGAFLLAASGVLTHGRATTHWEDLADLRQRHPALEVVDNVRWVDDGGPVSSAGISAGIDMCLHLVGRLAGTELAERTARQMDFAWTHN